MNNFADIYNTISTDINKRVSYYCGKMSDDYRKIFSGFDEMTQRMVMFSQANVDYKRYRRKISAWLNDGESIMNKLDEVQNVIRERSPELGRFSYEEQFYRIQSAIRAKEDVERKYSALMDNNPLLMDNTLSPAFRNQIECAVRKELETEFWKKAKLMIDKIVSRTISHAMDVNNRNGWR